MNKISLVFSFIFIILFSQTSFAQADSIVLKDLTWDKAAPAGSTELFIPSNGSQLAGLVYRANGMAKHPTLLLLHGYPGNERNLDLAQVIRAHGWNVIYFDYRGSWGSGGKFSFKNCVQDVVNVVAFCNQYQDSLKIDTSNIVLFGHSMGGWICLKALPQLPQIKKGFALSTWNIADDFKRVMNKDELLSLANRSDIGPKYFVLNATLEELFTPVINERSYFQLVNDGPKLANKQVVMLDEHGRNSQVAEAIERNNNAYFNYEVWKTDHSFTNKRVSLMNKLIAFLDR